jgi:hypothetical protein
MDNKALYEAVKALAKTLPPLGQVPPSTPIHGALRKQARKSYEGLDVDDGKDSPKKESKQQRYYRLRGGKPMFCQLCKKVVKQCHISKHCKSQKHRLALASLPPDTIPPTFTAL